MASVSQKAKITGKANVKLASNYKNTTVKLSTRGAVRLNVEKNQVVRVKRG